MGPIQHVQSGPLVPARLFLGSPKLRCRMTDAVDAELPRAGAAFDAAKDAVNRLLEQERPLDEV